MAEVPNKDNELISDLEEAVERVECLARDNIPTAEEEIFEEKHNERHSAQSNDKVTASNKFAGNSNVSDISANDHGVGSFSESPKFVDAGIDSDILMNPQDAELVKKLDIDFELDPGQDDFDDFDIAGISTDEPSKRVGANDQEKGNSSFEDSLQEPSGRFSAAVDETPQIGIARSTQGDERTHQADDDLQGELKQDWNVLFPEEAEQQTELQSESETQEQCDINIIVSDDVDTDQEVERSEQVFTDSPSDREISVEESTPALHHVLDDEQEAAGAKFAASIVKIQESQAEKPIDFSEESEDLRVTEKPYETTTSDESGRDSDKAFKRTTMFPWIAILVLFVAGIGLFGYWQKERVDDLQSTVSKFKASIEANALVYKRSADSLLKTEDTNKRIDGLVTKVDRLTGVVDHLNQRLKAGSDKNSTLDLSSLKEFSQLSESVALLERQVNELNAIKKKEKKNSNKSLNGHPQPTQSLTIPQSSNAEIEKLYQKTVNKRISDSRNAGKWIVNLASARTKKTIEKIKTEFENKGVFVQQKRVLINGKRWYRLQVSGLATKSEAQRFGEQAKTRLGLKSFWIER